MAVLKKGKELCLNFALRDVGRGMRISIYQSLRLDPKQSIDKDLIFVKN